MADQEPEYRRRIRQNAARNDRETQSEREKTAQNANADKVVGAIQRLGEKIDREGDENTPEKRRERRWHHAEVIGLWAAAAVGVGAILWGSHDSELSRKAMHDQQIVMQAQLAEMQAEQRPWISVSVFQPTMTVDADQITIGIRYSAHNSGHKPAMGGVPATSLTVPMITGIRGENLSSRDTCKKAEATAGGGFSIFPGDSPLMATDVAIPLAWLKDAVVDTKNGGARVVHVVIQFCIAYKEVGDPKTIHHTPYWLSLRDLTHGGGSLEFTGQAVPSDQLRFVQMPLFDTQAD